MSYNMKLHSVPLWTTSSSIIKDNDIIVPIAYSTPCRLGLPPDYTSANVGFRCASSVLPQARPVSTPPSVTPRPARIHSQEETWAFKVRQAIRKILGRRNGIYMPYRKEEL